VLQRAIPCASRSGPHLNYVPGLASITQPGATQALRDWHMLMQAKDAVNHVALARTPERPSVFHLIDALPKAQSHPPPARRNVHFSPAATFSPAVANTPTPSPNFGTPHQANYVDPSNPVDPANQGFHCATCAASGVTNLVNTGEFCRICGTPGTPGVPFQAVTQPEPPWPLDSEDLGSDQRQRGGCNDAEVLLCCWLDTAARGGHRPSLLASTTHSPHRRRDQTRPGSSCCQGPL
jgi:hypothetical protein